jgi:hypothetical protein
MRLRRARLSETERWMLLRNEAFPQARPALAPISIVTGWARLNETAPRERPPRANLRETPPREWPSRTRLNETSC